MAKKRITIELVFDEQQDDFDPEFTELVLKRIARVADLTTLTDGEIDGLGETVAQSDEWQVDNWNLLQQVLGSSRTPSVNL